MTTQEDPLTQVGQDSSPELGSVGRIDTPTVDSPIGRDAVSVGDAYPRAPEPTARVEPQEAIPEMKNEPAADPFAAEYDQQVADKAAIFDLMQRDPSMGGQVENFLAVLTGRAPQPQQATPVSQPNNAAPQGSDNELMQLRQQVQNLSQQVQNSQVSAAKQQIDTFSEQHSDFGRYRQQVGQLVTQHGLSLDDAYALVKARAGETVQPQSVETARANTTGRQSAPESSILEEARQTIANMKPNKRDRNAALRVAWKAATRHHNQ